MGGLIWTMLLLPSANGMAPPPVEECGRLLWTAKATLEEKWSFVNSVSFSPDGKTLASGGEDTIKLWEIRRPSEPRKK